MATKVKQSKTAPTIIPPLPKRIKARWLKWLRSGKYAQMQGTLKGKIDRNAGSGYGFCCLGVLRECMTPKEREAMKVDMSALSLLVHVDRRDGASSYYAVVNDKSQDRLTRLNDDKQWSFKKIAAYIERSKTI